MPPGRSAAFGAGPCALTGTISPVQKPSVPRTNMRHPSMRYSPVLLDHHTPSSGLQQGPREAAAPATRRASVDRVWRSALVACLLCFGALANTASAQEPEITTFLDFYSHRQSCGMRTHAHDHTFVQGFSTGGNETGYTLREVEFLVGRHPKYFTVHPQISLVEASPCPPRRWPRSNSTARDQLGRAVSSGLSTPWPPTPCRRM